MINKIVKSSDILHMAINLGDVDVVKCLYENGADIHNKNKKNESPLDVAKKNQEKYQGKFQEIVTYLEEKAQRYAQENMSPWRRGLIYLLNNAWRLLRDA